jgi:thiamine-phosphate pyrophosphorylase
LPARSDPRRTSIAEARLYLVSAARLGAGLLAELVPELAAAGVDLVQLREKEAEAGDLLAVGRPIASACREAGVPFIVNDRADVAVALDADGVHVGQNDIPPAIARRLLPAGVIGLSTHSPREVDDALERSGIDYFAVGPVYETPTKQGRPAAGLALVRHAAAAQAARPWFAIGGIDEHTLPDVMAAGATRIVVVRAITEAPDPPAAAARLKATLTEA